MIAYTAVGCRVVLVAVFLAATAGKVAARAEFGRSVRRMAPVPDQFVQPMVWLVLGAESLTIALLAVPAPAATPVGFGLAVLLLTLFSGAIIRVIRRGDRESCACFGKSSQPLSLVHVVRNGLLLVIGVVGFATTLMSSSAPRLGGVVLTLAAGLLVATLIARLDEIVALYRPVRAAPKSAPRLGPRPPGPRRPAAGHR